MEDIPKDILLKALEGDMQAFESIYRRASGFVFTVALRITNNSHDAQEVTQEVFLKVHRSLKDFQFRSSFKTWLYRVTVNTALNVYKRASRHMQGRDDFQSVIETYPSREDSANEIMGREEQQENETRLKSLLDRLSPGQRACIVLREIQGLSYKEMADALMTNINTVRTRLKRARQALLASARGGAL